MNLLTRAQMGLVSTGIVTLLAFGCSELGPVRMATTPGFTRAPAAAVAGHNVRIDFAASRPTDVAVWVENADGRLVRHLVAGRLGPNPPKPLVPDSLAQSLAWDGCDDHGRPVPAGRYHIRVGLELIASYNRALGWRPRALGTVHGLALGPTGNLYVMSETGRDYLDGQIQIFTPEGEYVRTILPRPADIPLDRAKPLGEMVLAGGERFPTSLLPQYGRRLYQVPIVTPEGDLIFTNGPPGGHLEGKRFSSVAWRQTHPRRLLRIAADGGAPLAGAFGPVLAGNGFRKALFSLAMGPDDKVYISGARHAVFRAAWGPEEKVEAFVGVPDQPGGGAEHLNEPCGIAFDAKGNLYVADRGNHRIAVFDRAGKLVSEIPIEWPRRIAVHLRTGAVYVAAGHRRYRLHKFAGLDAKKEVCSTDLRSGWPFLALDSEADPPAIYVANVDSAKPDAGPRVKVLVRLVDAGDELWFDKQLSEDARPRQPLLYGVDREREWVYGSWQFEGWWRMDGRTGEIETFRTRVAAKANGVSEITGGPAGMVVTHVTGEVGRLDPGLKPYPFSRTGTYIVDLPPEDCIRSYYGRDVTIAPNGDIYWIHERGGYGRPMRCSALHADGTLKKDSILVFETGSPAGVRVDREGCIYVLDHLKPLGQLLPEAFGGKVDLRRADRYVHNYGSILKFRPEGGRVSQVAEGAPRRDVLEPGRKAFTTAEGRGLFVADGLLWSHFGLSMIRPARPRDGCQCWTPRFDLDGFDRVFVPDQLRSRILVLDASGNRLTTFGRYGNVDDDGPGIPLADPRTVMVSETAAYVGDMTNQRVVRVALGYRRTAGCSVRVAGRSLYDLAREFREKEMLAERRRALRLMNARMRVEELQRYDLELSPSLRHKVDWDDVELRIVRYVSGALPNWDDARAVLCLTAAHQVPDWPEGEAARLLSTYYEEGNEGLRLAVAWALWGGTAGEPGRKLLHRALKDESQLVRVTAAYALLEERDPAGLAEIFRGAVSEDPAVFKIAETAMIKQVHGGRYTLDKEAVEALSLMLGETRAREGRGRSRWYLRRAAILLLRDTKDPGGSESTLLEELRDNRRLTGNNLNRVIAGLGAVRSPKAVPDLVWFVKRGRNPGWRGGHGDRAEREAAAALARIAHPDAVRPLIGLLASKTPATAEAALRALTGMFDPDAPGDVRLVPKGDKLVRVRIDKLPAPTTVRAAWEAFWKVHNDAYVWDENGPPLRRRGQ
jgi:HEAT repeat protein